MISEIAKDLVGDVPGWIALFLQLVGGGKKPATAAKEATLQRLPHMFGFGGVDEQLFESLRLLLPPDQRRLIDILVSRMHDYEEDIFRLMVTGMPCGCEMVDNPVKNPGKGAPTTIKEPVSWEMTDKDLRVKYLQAMADEVARGVAGGLSAMAAADAVVSGMRSRRLIMRNPTVQRAHELWAQATALIKTEVLDFFGVETFDEITGAKVASKIDSLAPSSAHASLSEASVPFWKSMFTHCPIRAAALGLSVIGLTIYILI